MFRLILTTTCTFQPNLKALALSRERDALSKELEARNTELMLVRRTGSDQERRILDLEQRLGAAQGRSTVWQWGIRISPILGVTSHDCLCAISRNTALLRLMTAK